jgi:hypothetical protein
MIASRWLKLEHFLRYTTSALTQTLSVSAIRPFSPQAFGYLRAFRTDRFARKQAYLARDWFTIWIGMLSYLIARAENHHTSSLHDAVPTWFEILAAKGFDQGWLSGINSSTVCSFSPNSPRVGIFVHAGEEDNSCPAIEFFCQHHVPVWYPWGRKEEIWACKYPWFARYGPLREQFQMGTTFLVQALSLPQPSRVEINMVEGSAPTSENKAHQTWHAFFAARD